VDDDKSQSKMSTNDESSSTSGTAARLTTSTVSLFGGNKGRSEKMSAEGASDPAPVTKAHIPNPTGITIIGGTTSHGFGFGFGAQASRSPTIFHPDNLVTLSIGQEEEKMVVCEAYLSRDSAFFRAALKKQWSEGQS
jgi:hypothetical protein